MPIKNSTIHSTVKIWHPELVNIYDSRIDEEVSIGAFVEIGGAKIGMHCKIGCQAYICPETVIEPYVFIGHGARFCNVKRPHAGVSQKDSLKGTIVKAGATIGAGAIILPGLVIGERAMVGAGAIVTKNVPDGITVVGNPAKSIRR